VSRTSPGMARGPGANSCRRNTVRRRRANPVDHRPTGATLPRTADVDRRRSLDHLAELPPDFGIGCRRGQAGVATTSAEPVGMFGGQQQLRSSHPSLATQESTRCMVELVEHQLAHPLDVDAGSCVLDCG